jgi:hypothetical protein
MKRYLLAQFVLLSALGVGTLSCAGSRETPESSSPPDTTPYTRPTVPEDYAPGGKKAIPPEVSAPQEKKDEIKKGDEKVKSDKSKTEEK